MFNCDFLLPLGVSPQLIIVLILFHYTISSGKTLPFQSSLFGSWISKIITQKLMTAYALILKLNMKINNNNNNNNSSSNNIKAFSQASWVRLDMKPNRKEKPKQGERKKEKSESTMKEVYGARLLHVLASSLKKICM
jgi:hypothetical protein